MMTEEFVQCIKCGNARALTHWSSGGEVNWVACSKCRTYYEFGVEKPELGMSDDEFWARVEEDTGVTSSPT